MTRLPPRDSGRNTPLSRMIAVTTAVTMSTTLATVAAPTSARAADTGFGSSFEVGDPVPAQSTAFGAELHNFSGERFSEYSLLGLVREVTSPGDSPGNEGPPNAADANPATKWLVRSSTGAITYELDEPAAITGYMLTSANDAPDRDPRDFEVEGSLDGQTWDRLDARTAQQWRADGMDNRFVTKDFQLAQRSSEYTFYRLTVTANNGAGDLMQLADWELLDEQRQPALSPMSTTIDSGPTSSHVAKTGVGFTGIRALQYAGRVQRSGDALATNELFEVDVTVSADSQLSYKIFPVLDSGQTYAATHVAVDLLFTDGTRLSETGATDAYGYPVAARAQGEARVLYPDQWNSVTVDLSAFEGMVVDAVLLTYSQADAPAGTPVQGWLDDIEIAAALMRDTSDGPISYVDTRRGTNSTDGYSRGNTIPATAWPNGFNFFTPMTNADTDRIIYHYQRENNAQNLPTLQGIGISHQPSLWMADRNQLALLPADGSNPTSSVTDRALAFRHENEVARPDLYSVEFDNGLTTSVTPTDHGGLYQFGFTGDTGSVLIDQVVGSSKLNIDSAGVLTGWVEGGSNHPGRTRMFVYGEFNQTPITAGATTRGDRNGSARYAAFDTSENNLVELRLATSLISLDQAEHSYQLELGTASFEDTQARVTAVWNERLGVISDVQGATDAELVTLYSSLYRLNLYPSSHFENTGTDENPVYKYASPVQPTSGAATDTTTNARIVDGKLYVNHGFWDTYRTAWPAFALLYPDLAAELTEGFVQQYRDGGWVSRWSSPGYVDSMTGTSSDVSFAEMVSAGVLDTELALDAYDSALKNATVLPPSDNVGRKGLDTSIFLGFTPASVHESASWGLEGFINDSGIAEMARLLSENPEVPEARRAQLAEEATYFEARAKHYVEMFNPEARAFTARNADGSWPVGADFNKLAWGGAFTEASGWTFGFHAPHDVDGLAALYGGRRGLVEELHEFLSTPERAELSTIHEAREARDIRIGMLGISNQVAHHIPYVLAEAGDPTGAQRVVRDIMQRVFVGSDIGQGYVGDEDNGEFSAWYIFSALGFYPLQVGSGDYTIGSPLYESATVSPLGGQQFTIKAAGTSTGDIYVDGVSINGAPITSTTFDGDLIRNGGEIRFTMSENPSTWGAKDLDEELEVPEVLVDATRTGLGTVTAGDGTAVGALTDDNMRSAVTFAGDTAVLTWKSASGPVVLHQYTLTSATGSGVGDPESWTVEASVDGQNWTELDRRSDQIFPFETQTRPFSVQGPEAAYSQFRLTVSTAQASRLGLAEIELFSKAATGGELSVTPADPQQVRVGEEFSGRLATIMGGGEPSKEYTVTVDYGDGADAEDATLTADGLGGLAVTAPHVFDAPGVYTAVVTVLDDTDAVASVTTQIAVFRDDSLVGSFNNVCIGDLNQNAANCDGENYSYDRAKLATSGFVQGQTHPIGETGLSFDLPDPGPGQPDNITGEGQTVAVDLGVGATQISLIGTATQGNKNLMGTLTFSDGSTQALPFQFGDWVDSANNPAFGNIQVGVSNGRLQGTSAEGGDRATAIYSSAPVTLDVDDSGVPKRVVSLTLPTEPGTLSNGGRTHVFAIASDGDRSASEDLSVTPGTVAAQTAGVVFEATLASWTGGHDLGGKSAVINWGDATPVDRIDLPIDTVTGVHTYAEAGTYTVWVTVDDGAQSASVSLEIEVENAAPGYAPQISVNPEVVNPGGVITVTGVGFAPEESVTVTLGTETTVRVRASLEGTISAELTTLGSAPDGPYPLIAVGDISQVEATGSVRIEAEDPDPVATAVTLTANVADPVVNESFALTATVAPGEAAGAVEFFDGEQALGSATVSGGVATVDVRAQTSGEHSYTARFVPADPNDFAGSVSQALVLEVRSAPVLAAELELSVSTVMQGGSLEVIGRGYAPGENVVIVLGSELVGLGNAEADEAGGFRLPVTVPADTPVGEHTIVAEGMDSGLSAEAVLAVSAADPTGPGEPKEPVAAGRGQGDGQLPDAGVNIGVLIAAMVALIVAGGSFVAVRNLGRFKKWSHSSDLHLR